MNKKIFWIASFPKSGNTWMRAIITSLFFSKEGEFEFNFLNNINHFDTPNAYDFVKKINLEDFNNLNKLSILSKYRVEAQKRALINSGDFGFFKTHSSNLKINNFDYTNSETTLGFIYLIRDPRDVAISWSLHEEKTIDEIIDLMVNKNTVMRNPDNINGIPMHVSSWSQNYLSWKKLDVPRLIIRYENLIKETKKTISDIVIFFEKNYNFSFKNKEILINNIIKNTSFEKLKKKELKEGFSEANKNYFFRKGTSHQWKNGLENKQINKIESSFKETMKILGYL